MKTALPCFLSALLTLSALAATGSLAAARANEDAEPPSSSTSARSDSLELFESTILPTLKAHCYDCHSSEAETMEGGLELDSPAGLLRGGDSGPMLSAHEPDHSRLMMMLRHHPDEPAMPPDEQLPDEVIVAFERWIQLGAPDSRTDSRPTAKEQRLAAAKQHWAFLPPQLVAPPAVEETDWVRDPVIDGFVLAQIEAAGIRPVEDASRQSLIRRLYFDLTGVPPSPQDIDAFVADGRPDAVSLLVDRLLQSPQFGERWGRHWLDVVRFAESSGMEFNFTYPHAWPYRNYVIDSLNTDKRFDLFLREQIAGDLLPAVEGESQEAAEARRIAAGVLSFGPKRHNSSGTEFRMDIADDQIDVVFKATQAMTVSCARCHDHKFDPIPTKDYYALAGIFLSTEPLYGTIKQKYSNNPTDLLPIGENAQAKHDAAEAHEQKTTETQALLTKKEAELKEATQAEEAARRRKTQADELLVAISDRIQATVIDTSAVTSTSAEQDAATQDAEQKSALLAEAVARTSTLKTDVETLKGQVEELKASQPARPHYAMTARDRDKPADTTLAVRGDFRNRGDVVPRGFLSAFHVPDAASVSPEHSGRLELAHWITSPDNPLTARVMVNRIWHHLFGRGIVSTVDNFGMIGKAPTHPELLDALAIRFMENGWSVKAAIREMVLSHTYQLSTQPADDCRSVDPDNRLFWRTTPRRLEAEVIRDAMLTVSGQLDLSRPDGSTVTGLGDRLVRGIAPEKIQPDSRHRSVYLPVVRDYVPELFDLFDFPSPSLVSGKRAVTNVPSQALYLRNSGFVAEQSRLAAERLLASPDATDDAARVDLSMRLALGRRPTDAERDAVLQMVDGIRQAALNPPADTEQTSDGNTVENPEQISSEAATLTAWSAWYLTLFATAEFRYLVDLTPEPEASSP